MVSRCTLVCLEKSQMYLSINTPRLWPSKQETPSNTARDRFSLLGLSSRTYIQSVCTQLHLLFIYKQKRIISTVWLRAEIPGVSANDNTRCLTHVDGFLLDDVLQYSAQSFLLCIGQLSGIAFPSWSHHLPHWVNQLHPIVFLSARKWWREIREMCVQSSTYITNTFHLSEMVALIV